MILQREREIFTKAGACDIMFHGIRNIDVSAKIRLLQLCAVEYICKIRRTN